MTLNLTRTALLAGTAFAIAAVPYIHNNRAAAGGGANGHPSHVASVPSVDDAARAAAHRFEAPPAATPGFRAGFEAPRSFEDMTPVIAQTAPTGGTGGFPPLGFDPTTDPSPTESRRPPEPAYPSQPTAPARDAARTAPSPASATPVGPYPSAQSTPQPGAWPSNPYPASGALTPTVQTQPSATPYYGSPSAAVPQPRQPSTPYYNAPAAPAPSFPQPAPSYQQAAPAYPQAAPTYPQAAPVYPQAAPTYPQAAPTYPPTPSAPAYRTPTSAQQPAAYPAAPQQAPAYGGYPAQQPAPAHSRHAVPAYPGSGYAPQVPAYAAPSYGQQGQWSVQPGYAPTYGYGAPPAGWTPGWTPMPYPAYPAAPYGHQPAYPGYGTSYGTTAPQPAARPSPAAPAYRQPAPAPRRPGRSGGNLWATGEVSVAASQSAAKQRFTAGTVLPSADAAYRRSGIYAPAEGFDWEHVAPGGAPAPAAQGYPVAPAANVNIEAAPRHPVSCSFHSGCVAAAQYDAGGADPSNGRPAYTTQWSSAMFDASSFYDGTDLR